MEVPPVRVSTPVLVHILKYFAERRVTWKLTVKCETRENSGSYCDLVATVEKMMNEKRSVSTSLFPVAPFFEFPYEALRTDRNGIRKLWPAEDRYVRPFVLHMVVWFIGVAGVADMQLHFQGLLEIIRRAEGEIPGELDFALGMCTARCVSNIPDLISVNTARLCLGGDISRRWSLVDFIACTALKNDDDACFEYVVNRVCSERVVEDDCFDVLVDGFMRTRIDAMDDVSLRFVAYLCAVRPNNAILMSVVHMLPGVLRKRADVNMRLMSEGADEEASPRKEIRLGSEDRARVEIQRPMEVEIMVRFLLSVPHVYSDAFFEEFAPSDDTSALLLLSLISECREITVTPRVIGNIVTSLLLSPKIAVFEKNGKYDAVLYARKVLFDLMITRDGGSSLPRSDSDGSFLVSEMIGRMHNVLSEVDLSVVKDENTLMQILMVASALITDKPSVKSRHAKQILVFIFAIMKNVPIAKVIWRSVKLSSVIISWIFESTIEQDVLVALSGWIEQCSRAFNLRPVVYVLSRVISDCVKEVQIVRLVSAITAGMRENRQAHCYMKKLVSPVTDLLEKIPTKECLEVVLQFYARMTLDFERLNMEKVTHHVRAIEGNEISHDVAMTFMSMIAPTELLSLDAEVLIKRPSMIVPFLSVFSSEDSALPYITCLGRLCKWSMHNCLECHIGELDMLLLEMLGTSDNSLRFRGMTFKYILRRTDLLLDIVSCIVSIISSPVVAIKCIPLMTANEQFFMRLCEVARANKHNVVPIGYPVPGLRDIPDFNEGKVSLSVQFWMRADDTLIDHMKSAVELVSVVDTNFELRVVVDGTTLLISILNGSESMTRVLTANFPSNAWCMVTVICERCLQGVKIRYYLDSTEVAHMFWRVPIIWTEGIKWEVGARMTSENQVGGGFPVLLSDVRLFDRSFTSLEISRIHSSWCNVPSAPTVWRSDRSLQFTTIIDVYGETSVFQYLLPLFRMFNDAWTGFPKCFLDFLGNVIRCSRDLRVDFNVVAFLIAEQKLSYAVYESFVKILEMCLNPRITSNILESVVLNFQLWIKCPDLVDVAKHWGSELPTKFLTHIQEIYPFHVLLGHMRYWFYFEKSYPDAPERCDDIDVKSCRESLNDLALAVTRNSFSESDARSLISHIVHGSDESETCSLLGLFLRISNECRISGAIAPLMFYMFKAQRENVFATSLKILCNISGEDFTNYGAAIVTLMNQYYYRVELYDALAEILREYPQTYVVFLHVALSVSDETCRRAVSVLQTVDPASFDPCRPSWLVFMLMLAARLSKRRHEVLIVIVNAILARFSYKVLDSVICFVRFFGGFMNIDVRDFVMDITRGVAEKQLNCKDDKVRGKIFLACVSALMFVTYPSSGPPKENTLQGVQDALGTGPRSLVMESVLPSNEGLKVTAARLFQTIQKRREPIDTLGRYISMSAQTQRPSVDQQRVMNKELEDMFPDFYKAIYEMNINFMKKHYKAVHRLWRSARIASAEYCAIFTANDVTLATGIILRITDELITKQRAMEWAFKSLRKYAMHEFSIWKANDEFFKEVKRCSRYTLSFSQVRMRKSLNVSGDCISTQPHVEDQIASFNCRRIKVGSVTDAILIITQNEIYVNGIIRPIQHIRAVFMRYRLHRRNSVEIIMKTGEAFLLDFGKTDALDVVNVFKNFSTIRLLQTVDCHEFMKQRGYTEQWQNRQMTNFQYIMMVNMFSGRTFNDANLYPIFPWLLKEFTKIEAIVETIDNIGSVVFLPNDDLRDLSLPIVAQSTSKQEDLRDKVAAQTTGSGIATGYMAGPSNATIVSHWLLRQPPFTRVHKDTQDGKFGFYARLFQSMSRAAVQVLAGLGCWELVPEFYSHPEVLVNLNGYEIGEGVDNIFTIEQAYEFVYLMRKVLESEFVSRHLNEWLDLIFGVNTNEPSKYSVYNSCLYDNVWDNERRLDTAFVEDSLKCNGQLPARLFKTPHPRRENNGENQRAISVRRVAVIVGAFSDPHAVKVSWLRGSVGLLSFAGSVAQLGFFADNGSLSRVSVNFETSSFSVEDVTGTIAPGSICARRYGLMILIDKDSGRGLELTATYARELPIRDASYQHVAVSIDTAAICSTAGRITWWYVEDRLETNTEFVFEKISYLEISRTLGALVIGTMEGYVYVCDLVNGQISFRCDMKGCVPKLVLVSASGAFIVVYSDDCSITLFSPNGHEIRRVSLDHDVVAWKAFTGYEGFDYLMIADSKGRVRLCELFYLNFAEPFYIGRSPIILMEYQWDARTALLVTEEGECLLMSASSSL